MKLEEEKRLKEKEEEAAKAQVCLKKLYYELHIFSLS